MKQWLTRSLWVGLAVLLILVAVAYYQVRSMGLIPRYDYDTEAPNLPAFSRPAVLVFTKTNGFIHKEAIPVAKSVLSSLITEQGWQAYLTDNAAVHSPELLAQFDLIIWNNVSGDVLTELQRDALRQWLEGGGGWLGIHASGGDSSYRWQWYVDTLVGAQFIGHTMHPQFQDADVLVADPASPITQHLPSPWLVADEEWYAFAANPRDKGYEILLTVDESSYQVKGDSLFGSDHMPGEHPIAWRHALGKGRVLYSAIGHQPHTYRLADYQRFLVEAMHWLKSPLKTAQPDPAKAVPAVEREGEL
ncbi:ThuA domain-containing protein [Zhongshania sp.]|uniref:ThuA domain-containing protein n=1 Tax=Zhongshania sp. TaxID=1971902 RepID=UPI001B73A8E8|nr:ThuA domain-containing protein [Zhongshania sp.]MBQ0794961.1 ThuA domain-containing protein [Zhongshania sp.]